MRPTLSSLVTQAAADKYYQSRGYTNAYQYNCPITLTSGRTIIPGINVICDAVVHHCDTIGWITAQV